MSRAKRSGNLGTTALRKRASTRDPMQLYDELPPSLRAWLANAAMPWSPRSCLKIWSRAQREGLSSDLILGKLDQLEAATLSKHRGI